MKPLEPAQLTRLPEDWVLAEDGKSIRRSITFKSFPEAFSFITHVALLAEKMDHHPDWSNSYTKVDIALTTHDAGGVTEKDLELAEKISKFDWTK